MKKGAIGLSINTLVIIIISIVILSGGVGLLYKFVGGSEEIKEQLDARTSAELERLLVNQGQRVALPLHKAVVPRGESHVFGLGIMNIGEGEVFRVEITTATKVDLEGNDLQVEVIDWVLYDNGEKNILEGESRKETIMVSVPEGAPLGIYSFNARVYSEDGERYGQTQKFHVTVT